ncbi:MAG: trehalose-phosphatase [bacterium]
MLYNGIEKIDEIKKIIAAVNPGITVFCVDFDGTLVKICKSPHDVVVTGELYNFLSEFDNTENVFLCIITGRELSDVENRVKLKKNIIYSGNHGYEIKSYYENFKLNFLVENAGKYVPLLAKALNQVKKIDLKNLIVENKKFSISLHYRLLDNGGAKFLKRNIKEIINENPEFKQYLHITRGKKILEIRPKIKWNKGSACDYIVKELSKKLEKGASDILRVALGDDITDETMFSGGYYIDTGKTRVNINTINCVIGKKKSSASFYLNNYKQTPVFIKEILTVLNEKPEL